MNMQELFDTLVLPDLEGYIAAGQEENLVLEFKTINTADLSHSDDKKNLAKGLSGFANSSGGLIIWGIDARKNQNGINSANAKKEIQPLSLFLARLNEFTGLAISPIVEGVRHKGIPTMGDVGFAVSVIPESDSGPHMAKFNEDRYYKRSGDSFYRMEHFDIEDMFGRRRKPKLRVLVRLVGGNIETSGGKHTLTVQALISIENYGRGSAKAPFLAIIIKSKHQFSGYGIDWNRNFGLDRIVRSRTGIDDAYGGNANAIIHPGIIHDVTGISVKIHEDAKDVDDIVFGYQLVAEDFRMITDEMVVHGAELIRFVKSKVDATA